MDGRPVAPSHSISQLTLMTSAKGVGVPSLADNPILLSGCLEGSRPLGEVGSLGLPSWTMLPGAEQAAGGPSEDPGLTLASPDLDNYLNTLWCYHPFPFCYCSHSAALPQSGEEVPCACRFWGQEASTRRT